MPAWKAMQQSLREWMYRAERAEAERNEWKQRAEAAEAKLAAANTRMAELEEQVEDLDAQVCGVPIGEICRMAQGQATPKDRATITIWLTIEDQRRANSRKENEQ